MQEVFKKLKRGVLKISKSLNTHTQGGHRSLFKGSGLAFDDIRPYQYGDDVRSIHWPVSSKGHGTYVKTFKEEREQTVLFLVDVSASQHISTVHKQKIALAREVCGTLLLSAIEDSNQVGLMLFSDQVECVIKPQKGQQQAHRLLHTLYHFPPSAKGTNLAESLGKALQFIKRTCIMVLISDFIDEGYAKKLKTAMRRHDLIVLHIQGTEEHTFPSLGIVPLYEAELGQLRWCNTSRQAYQETIRTRLAQRAHTLSKQVIRQGGDYVALRCDKDYLSPLISLFRRRNHVKKRAV